MPILIHRGNLEIYKKDYITNKTKRHWCFNIDYTQCNLQ